MHVFTLDHHRQPIMPCERLRARALLRVARAGNPAHGFQIDDLDQGILPEGGAEALMWPSPQAYGPLTITIPVDAAQGVHRRCRRRLMHSQGYRYSHTQMTRTTEAVERQGA